MLPLLMAALALAQSPADTTPLAPITAYNGTWTITSPHPMAGPGKTDTLVNHCTMNQAFYTCEQVVNGKPLALIIFTSAGAPNKFYVQNVLPDGHAAGRTDLTLAGDHWTFSNKDDKGNWYRTENIFTGPDHIHFDQFSSPDGTTWKKTGEGDEVRVAP